MTLIDQIMNGESKILEFKEKLPGSENIARTAVAFSNSSGGKLLIGVSNEGHVVGIPETDILAAQEAIASIIYDSCYPNIVPDIYTVNHDGKLILVVEIFRGSLPPYYIKKSGKNAGTYIRIASSNRKASQENILELERQRLNRSFDEEASYSIPLDELNLSPILSRFAAKGRDLKTEQLLNFKLLVEENHKLLPTNGLLILLGQPGHVTIKCSRFKGKNMDVFLDKKEYGGDLFGQLDNAVAFILNHINIRAEINGLKRTDIPEIPLAAIREALINAIVHRDYTNPGRDIKLGIYDDMLNLVSPGGLPSSLTEQIILEGRSEIRNRVVARVFKELDYIEQWGSGIRRIISACASAGLATPVFREKGDFFDVEIFRRVSKSANSVPDTANSVPDTANSVPDTANSVPDTANSVPDTARSTSKNAENSFRTYTTRIVKFLENSVSITTGELAAFFGVKERRARAILQQMVSRQILKKIGSARNTRYILAGGHKK